MLKSEEVIGVTVTAILGVAFVVISHTPPKRASVHTEVKIPRHGYYIRRNYLRRVIGAFRRLNPASGMIALQNFSGALFYGIIWFTVSLAIAQGLAESLPGVSLSVFDFAMWCSARRSARWRTAGTSARW